MKKFVICLAALLIIAVAAISVIQFDGGMPAIFASKATPTPAPAVEENVQPVAKKVDYDALRGAFPADETVADVNGVEINWDTFCNWISYYARMVEENMVAYSYYGMGFTWDDILNKETGVTYAQYAPTQAGNYMQQIYSVMNYAEQNGIVVADIDEQVNDRINADKMTIGENVTDEEFDEALKEQGMSRSQYEQILRFNILYNEINNIRFGENGEKIPEEEAIAYLKENGYYAANHILLMTGDPQSEEGYDAERIAEAEAKANEISAELRAIENKDELVARFLELKNEYDEDTGKVAYPNGYVFHLADMVPEFSNMVEAAEDYQVSEPILSAYGYHVIIRMPLDADAVITGQQGSARMLLAQEKFNALIEEMFSATKVTLRPVMDSFNMSDYIK